MNKQSMLDTAYEYLISKKGETVSFEDLFVYVAEQLGIVDEDGDKKALFYTNLTLDGRFILLSDNTWDLRSLHPSDEYEIDMKNAYNEGDEIDDTSDDEEEDDLLEKDEIDSEDNDNHEYDTNHEDSESHLY